MPDLATPTEFELVPGYPAIADTTVPQAVFPEAVKVAASTLSDPNLFTPNQTFPYIVNGFPMTFYDGIPVILDADTHDALIAAGYGS